MDSNTVKTILTELIGQYGWVILVLFIVTLFKKYIEALVDGIMVFYGSDIDEDDIVFINGRVGRVTKHGWFKTKIFMKDNNSMMVIQNRRLPNILIEKYLPNNSLKKINDR